MTTSSDAVVIPPSAHRTLEAAGCHLEILASAEQTSGTFSIVDFRAPPSFVAPPLLHRHSRESWWGQVLEGEVAVELEGGRVLEVPTGGVVFIPVGVAFRWSNPNPRPARWLLHYTPGGFEEYFAELAAEIHRRSPKNPAEMAAIAEPLWAKYGVSTVKVAR